MKHTIAGLMILVLACGIAIASLKNASELWAGILLSLVLGVLATSLLAFLNRRGAIRAFWQGFAIFGWGYLVLSSAPWFAEQVAPKLPTTALLTYAHERVHPNTTTVTGMINFGVGSASPSGSISIVQVQTVGTPLISAQPASGAVVPPPAPGNAAAQPAGSTTQPTTIIWMLSNLDQFQRVGHCLFALLAAYLGGVIGRWFHRSNREPVSPTPS